MEQGFGLHKIKGEKEKCLFCQKPFGSDFLSLLSKHFNKDYEGLQKAITQLGKETSKLKKEKLDLKNNEFHPDLIADYTKQVSTLNDIIEKLNFWIDSVISKLKDKHINPLIIIADSPSPENFLGTYNGIVHELNKLVSTHNKKVENHTTEVKNARDKLELHSIAQALPEQDYKKLKDEIKKASTKEKDALEAVNKNNADILKLEKDASDIGIATDKINSHLKEFFGREEIKLELDEDKKGYIIQRDEQMAKSLSESEKTAIAFSYFIVKVEEKNFKVDESIIFIDDPISSFDSSFIYHVFSLIKNHFNRAEQLFISTHNFQFFNLIKDWFVRKNRNIEEKNKELVSQGNHKKPIPCEFYMIKSDFDSGKRNAKIIKLDDSLKNNKSEYSFLFRLLKDFDENRNEPTVEDIYNVANIGRRFFDIFADFKIPTNTMEPKNKMDIIVKEINKSNKDKISKIDCDKAFWLMNHFSHNSDPISTIEHIDKSESRDAIKILLKIVKESDKKHYEILEKAL